MCAASQFGKTWSTKRMEFRVYVGDGSVTLACLSGRDENFSLRENLHKFLVILAADCVSFAAVQCTMKVIYVECCHYHHCTSAYTQGKDTENFVEEKQKKFGWKEREKKLFKI